MCHDLPSHALFDPEGQPNMNIIEDPRDLDRAFEAMDAAQERERVRKLDCGLECEHCGEPMGVGRAVFTNRRYVLCDECFDRAVDEYRARMERRNPNRYKEASCRGTL